MRTGDIPRSRSGLLPASSISISILGASFTPACSTARPPAWCMTTYGAKHPHLMPRGVPSAILLGGAPIGPAQTHHHAGLRLKRLRPRYPREMRMKTMTSSRGQAKRQVRGGQPGAITGRHAPLVEKNIPADASKCQECACCCFWLLLVCSSKVINRQIN